MHVIFTCPVYLIMECSLASTLNSLFKLILHNKEWFPTKPVVNTTDSQRWVVSQIKGFIIWMSFAFPHPIGLQILTAKADPKLDGLVYRQFLICITSLSHTYCWILCYTKHFLQPTSPAAWRARCKMTNVNPVFSFLFSVTYLIDLKKQDSILSRI